MLEFEKLKNLLLNNDSFLLTSHINPDPDAIGSEIAFYFILKQLGKKVYIINYNETPENSKFLDIDGVIQKFEEAKHAQLFNQVDVLIALDFNHSSRIKTLTPFFNESDKIKICIDHHQNPEDFVDHLFVDTNYSATAEIIYEFVKSTNIVKLNFEISQAVYAAVLTDTGSFRFDRTSSNTHLMVADLIKCGVNPSAVYDEIYDKNSFGRLKLLGDVLSNLQLSQNNKVCYMVIRNDMLNKHKVIEEEVDGFVNFCLSIKGVEVGLLFFELSDGMKISFRSKGNIAISELAAKYGGGGHKNAAGARLYDINFDHYVDEIVDGASKYF